MDFDDMFELQDSLVTWLSDNDIDPNEAVPFLMFALVIHLHAANPTKSDDEIVAFTTQHLRGLAKTLLEIQTLT